MSEQVKIRIPDMKCKGCAHTLEESLGKVQGVQNVNVDLSTKTAFLTTQPGTFHVEEAVKAAHTSGFEEAGLSEK